MTAGKKYPAIPKILEEKTKKRKRKLQFLCAHPTLGNLQPFPNPKNIPVDLFLCFYW